MNEQMGIQFYSWLKSIIEQMIHSRFHSDLLSTGAGSSDGGKAGPGVLAVFQDYLKLMSPVAEANQISKELKKIIYQGPESHTQWHVQKRPRRTGTHLPRSHSPRLPLGIR